MNGTKEMLVLERAEKKKVTRLTVGEAYRLLLNVQSKVTTRRINAEYERVTGIKLSYN